MKVTDPSGQTWRVSRRWLPWRRRASKKDVDPLDAIDFVDADPASWAVAAVFFFLALLLPVVLLAVLVAVELLLLLALLPFAVLARVLFGRHWRVELRRGWTPWHEEEAGGWQASGLRIHDLAADLRRGAIPVRTLGAAASA